MNSYASRRMATVMTLAGLTALAGCAGRAPGSRPSATPVYRCEQGLQFTVEFVDDTAVLKGARGDDVLLRDAGGEGTQTVYSNPRMRAEFGLGAGGREAVLRYPLLPLVAHCARN